MLLTLIPIVGMGTADADMVILKSGEIFQTPKAWTENGIVKYYKDGRVSSVDKGEVERLIHSPAALEKKSPAADRPAADRAAPPDNPAAAPSISPTLPKGEAVGYLDLTWGQSPTGIEGLVLVGTDPAYGGVQQYSSQQGRRHFGRASVDDIVFGFWQDGLYTITVWTRNFLDFRDLKEEAFRRYGKGMQNRADVEKYYWIDKGSDRMLSYDGESDTGYLWMRSRAMHKIVSARYPD